MIVKVHSKATAIPLTIADFNRLGGMTECYGINGIKNLINALKTDVKAICRDYNIFIPKPPARMLELKPLMFHFNIYWEQWSTSNYCHLTNDEVKIINLYRKNHDLTWVSNQIGLTYDLVLAYLAKAIRKLKSVEAIILFQKWKDFKHLDSQKPDEFLDVPLEGLHHVFPNRVYHVLQLFGKNMREVLERATVKDLHRYRNFGTKAENELRVILKKYQCLHLLKK